MFELSSGWDLWSAKDSFLESSFQSFLGSFFGLLCCLKTLHFLCLERALLIISSVRVEVMRSLCVSPPFPPPTPLSVSLGADSATARSTHCRTFSFCKILTKGILEQTCIKEQNTAKAWSRAAFLHLPHSLQRPCLWGQLWWVRVDKENSLWKREELLEKSVAHTLLIVLQDACLPAHE